jgi:3-oxoacyl-[acyl-carrier-protein] synthase II
LSSRNDQIVITGAGLITPLGLTRDATWRAVLENRCGMGPMSAMESALPAGADGGQAPDLPADFGPQLPREARYLRHAIRQALDDAKLTTNLPYPSDRCGVVLGTTLQGMRSAGQFLRRNDYALLKDFQAGAVLRSAAGDLGFTGCGLTTCSACSSSLGSIALGMTLLRSGQLDLVVAGGYDTISEYVYGGFNSLRLVSPGQLRPFARDRQGMKLSEGYGIVVLEREDAARRRGREGLAAILGFGESADAHHLTQPHPEGEGAARAIEAALRDSRLGAEDIDLIAAHATGTPDNDAAEYAALSRVFREQLSRVPVVAFKSHLGHTLGGAGAVELILSMMALREQVVPACASLRAGDIEFDGLQVSTGASRKTRIRATLNTSLGFGGANTCVVLGESSSVPRADVRPRTDEDVYVTGIGVIFPGIVGNEAFAARLSDQAACLVARDTGSVSDSEISGLLNARRVRRMSEYVKLSLAATVLCLRDAGIDEVASLGESCGAILGSAHASANYSESYYREIVTSGIAAANPMLFAEGVPNAAAAHLSLMLSLKGPCQTIIGTRTAGLDAIRLAAARIASGHWNRSLVSAAEEFAPVVNAAYGHWGLYGEKGFVVGSGAVTLLLEGRQSLETRGGRALASVVDAIGGTPGSRGPARAVRTVLQRVGAGGLVIGSANGTWVDRVEAAAVRRYGGAIWSPYGAIAECFSALPLAGIAAVLLKSKAPGIAPALQDRRFCSIATDYSGAVSGVALELI